MNVYGHKTPKNLLFYTSYTYKNAKAVNLKTPNTGLTNKRIIHDDGRRRWTDKYVNNIVLFMGFGQLFLKYISI